MKQKKHYTAPEVLSTIIRMNHHLLSGSELPVYKDEEAYEYDVQYSRSHHSVWDD